MEWRHNKLIGIGAAILAVMAVLVTAGLFIQRMMASRAEYQHANEWIAYEEGLGRPPTAEERAQWMEQHEPQRSRSESAGQPE